MSLDLPNFSDACLYIKPTQKLCPLENVHSQTTKIIRYLMLEELALGPGIVLKQAVRTKKEEELL